MSQIMMTIGLLCSQNKDSELLTYEEIKLGATPAREGPSCNYTVKKQTLTL